MGANIRKEEFLELSPGVVYQKVEGGIIARVSDDMHKAFQDILSSTPLITYTNLSDAWNQLQGNGEVQFIPTVEENPSKFLAGFTQMSPNTVESVILTPELFQERDKNGDFDSIKSHAHKQLDAVERKAKGEIGLSSIKPALTLFEMKLKDEEEAGKKALNSLFTLIRLAGNAGKEKQDLSHALRKIVDEKIMPILAPILDEMYEGYSLYPSLEWQSHYEKIPAIVNSFLTTIFKIDIDNFSMISFSDFIGLHQVKTGMSNE